MKLSAIFWNNKVQMSMDNLLPSDVAESTEIFEVASFSEVLECLQKYTEINMILTVIRPTDIQALYQVQQLQDHYPGLTLVALFASDSQISVSTSARLLFEPMSGTTIIEPTSDVNLDDCAEAELTAPEGFHLTPRQRDVLALLMRGKSNKEIARELDLSEGTVKIHCMAIFREMGVVNRTQAAMRGDELFGEAG